MDCLWWGGALHGRSLCANDQHRQRYAKSTWEKIFIKNIIAIMACAKVYIFHDIDQKLKILFYSD